MFIVIDGLDGSGKSTQAELLCGHLDSLGKSYVMRSHPSDDNLGLGATITVGPAERELPTREETRFTPNARIGDPRCTMSVVNDLLPLPATMLLHSAISSSLKGSG